jgi:hypothetical protein
MIEHLKNLDKNLDKNWTLVFKSIFAISVFLLYRVLVRSIDFDSLQTFNLIFVLAGFAVYSIKYLVKILISSFSIFVKSKNVNKSNIYLNTYIAFLFCALSILFIFFYYFSHTYGWASATVISINSGFLVWIQAKEVNSKWLKYFIWLVISCGIASIIHSFYYDDLVNIFSFIFIVLFFILDFYTEMQSK